MTDPQKKTYAAPALDVLGGLATHTAGPTQDAPEQLDALIGGTGGFAQVRPVDPS